MTLRYRTRSRMVDHAGMSSRLVTLLGSTVRRQGESRELSQRRLAELAGVSQAAVARIERGDRSPSVPVLERLLAAMDLQLAVTVEPLDAQLDARMAELAARPLADRIDDLGLDRIPDRLGDLPYVPPGAPPRCSRGHRCRSRRRRSRSAGATRPGSSPGWRPPTGSGGTPGGASSAGCDRSQRSPASTGGRPGTASCGP